ncbi:MAG: hypothetical protein A2Z96_04550 [Spirochaetes bacterium GWB1_48_6]|nr:MAG: hypothetical protein A2Z96_04550 [Spirochaetes bacterium GWB1_48_6]
MRNKIADLDVFLRDRGIKASFQRIKIYDYLQCSFTHPSVSMIYEDLHPQIPSLSRATVYNTLNLFLEKKLVQVVNTEGSEARFDLADPHHGHFTCESCGTIIDIPLDKAPALPEGLTGFEVFETQLHFRGKCPQCSSKN